MARDTPGTRTQTRGPMDGEDNMSMRTKGEHTGPMRAESGARGGCRAQPAAVRAAARTAETSTISKKTARPVQTQKAIAPLVSWKSTETARGRKPASKGGGHTQGEARVGRGRHGGGWRRKGAERSVSAAASARPRLERSLCDCARRTARCRIPADALVRVRPSDLRPSPSSPSPLTPPVGARAHRGRAAAARRPSRRRASRA
jgi:hypothetical protein